MPDLLEIENLHISFSLSDGREVQIVHGISLAVKEKEIVAIVGESGCGKSVTARSIPGLLPSAARVSGLICYNGINLPGLPENTLRTFRGKEIGMVFQDPAAALNPLLTVGEQVAETIRQDDKVGKREAWAKAVEMLRAVGLSDPEKRMRQYPHELSGGMKQRVMIAAALACRPKLLIADEPTASLDVTVQAQILTMLRNLVDNTGMSVVLITHDLSLVGHIAERVYIMYAGRIVEFAPTGDLFSAARHPYTRALLKAIPAPDLPPKSSLEVIEGNVPPAFAEMKGCPFAPRCALATSNCYNIMPGYIDIRKGHRAACLLLQTKGQDFVRMSGE